MSSMDATTSVPLPTALGRRFTLQKRVGDLIFARPVAWIGCHIIQTKYQISLPSTELMVIHSRRSVLFLNIKRRTRNASAPILRRQRIPCKSPKCADSLRSLENNSTHSDDSARMRVSGYGTPVSVETSARGNYRVRKAL